MTDKRRARCTAARILIDYCQLSLNDVLDSPDGPGADSRHPVHIIIRAAELGMEHMTPISAYVHYLECCNPARRIFNDHRQSAWDVQEV